MSNIQKNRKKTPVLFDIVEKIEKSTSTVEELRVPIFAPIQKISANSKTFKEFMEKKKRRTIKTSWGELEIQVNLLTQVHRDILDCIYTCSRKVKKLDSGRVAIYFSQTEVLKTYGDSTGNNCEWLRQKLEEIRQTVIKYKSNNGDSFDFNIISHLDYSSTHESYGITLDERYVKFYEQSLSINYKKKLNELLEIKSALLKAIIRFFFTHKEIRIRLDDVLRTIGFPIESPKTLQLAKKELRESVELLQSFGIEYNYKLQSFYYRGNDSVGFIPSLIA